MMLKARVLSAKLWILSVLHLIVNGEMINMRIVDETMSYTWQQHGANHQETKLEMRVKPSPFSGPQHLKRLANKCFSSTIEKYEYQFCPFSNITQKEVNSNSWNPYQGILGVWQEWRITDNHFTSMMMLMGDQCGRNPRQTEVFLQCGKTNDVISVTEPRHCEYEVVFSTPLTCHNHSMLVYPTLNKELQAKWNLLLGELKAEEITEKGYQNSLTHIFKEAGYLLHSMSADSKDATKKVASAEVKQADSVVNTIAGNGYTDLNTCNQAYESLKEELEQTKEQLRRFL